MPTSVYWEWLTSAGKEKYRNTAAPGQTSERNPFTGEPILTLSQGKYPEMHRNKTRVLIGNVVYNVASDRIERFVQPDTTEWAISPEVAARFLSVDPLMKSYPMLTPYQFADNSPIANIDLEGAEKLYFQLNLKNDGSAILTRTKKEDIISNTWSWDSWSFERKVNQRLELKVQYSARGNFTFCNYNQMASFLRDPEHSDYSWEELEIMQRELIMSDFAFSAVRTGVIAAESSQVLFRGTTIGYAGNMSLQKLGITPTSLDPVVATIMATEAEAYGAGIVYMATEADLQGVKLLANANVLQELEREVAVELQPLSFAQRASTSITAQQSRQIIKELGISIPSKINKSQISSTIKDLPRLTGDQLKKYVERATEISGKVK